MNNYSGYHCPVCGSAFTDQDDIVVCPDCGTPHHRECWAKTNRCANAAQHGSGLEWQKDGMVLPGQTQQVACPQCGSRNDPEAKQCHHCGTPLKEDAPPPPRQEQPRYTQAPPPPGQEEIPFPPGAQVLGPDDPISGIKSRDWACFVRRSVPYYLMRFLQMDLSGSKVAVNFGAFIFGCYYFFYRKMYKIAFAFFGAKLVLTLPTLVLFWYDTGSTLTAGIDPQFWMTALTVCSYLEWGLRLAAGLFGVYLYKNHAAKAIHTVCSATPEGVQRNARLNLMGGVNFAAPIAAAILSTGIISLLMVAFAGPQLMEVLQLYMSQLYAL